MSKQLENLLNQYKNKIFLRDDYNVEAVLLFNEDIDVIRKFILKFKLSKLTHKEEKTKIIETIKFEDFKYLNFVDDIRINPPVKKPGDYKIIPIEKEIIETNHFFSIEKFVIYGLERGYDWEVYGRPQWEAIQPEKKKRFIKPKIKKEEVKLDSPKELIEKVIKKHLNPTKLYDVLDEMSRTIALIPSQLKREIYVKQLSNDFNFDYEVLKNQVEFKRNNFKHKKR